MTPLEAAIRAVCRHVGALEDEWRGFEDLGRVALTALLDALPADLAAQVREHLHPEPPSRSQVTEAT